MDGRREGEQRIVCPRIKRKKIKKTKAETKGSIPSAAEQGDQHGPLVVIVIKNADGLDPCHCIIMINEFGLT